MIIFLFCTFSFFLNDYNLPFHIYLDFILISIRQLSRFKLYSFFFVKHPPKFIFYFIFYYKPNRKRLNRLMN